MKKSEIYLNGFYALSTILLFHLLLLSHLYHRYEPLLSKTIFVTFVIIYNYFTAHMVVDFYKTSKNDIIKYYQKHFN